MSKLLFIKDYILLALGTLDDLSENVRLVDGLLPKVMEIKYGYVPPNFRQKSYRESLSRLLSTGNMSRQVDKRGNVSLVLTASGTARIKRRFPIFFKNQWDGNFMIVVFDIPEKKKIGRQVLRNKLKELGFGMLQESVWISPYHFEEDLREFLDIKGYADYTFVLKAQSLTGENLRELARKIWRLDLVENGYNKILAGEFGPADAWSEYLRILSSDPLLPDDLLPSNWPRDEVVRYLKNVFLPKNMRPLKKWQ
jgi:phenylacetic acid degradation operon negative regulatory protein